jgi:hypothetical protein
MSKKERNVFLNTFERLQQLTVFIITSLYFLMQCSSQGFFVLHITCITYIGYKSQNRLFLYLRNDIIEKGRQVHIQLQKATKIKLPYL